MKIRLALAPACAALVAGCSATPPAAAPVQTKTETVVAPPATTAPPTTTAAEAVPAPASKTCTVPNVVGLVHQTAQDTMQAAGLYMLREEDATGQGRMLVVDRNWTTIAQSVAAGQVVDCNTEILLSAKKTDE
ncbi:PASTA domain-containing protein [Saccharothrix saharensis]|uniref:PASTA domain-containing protein n=1 Tax=Saccharothrix saharensis TaxID=571190 RepID=UPI0036B1D0B8